MFEDLYDVLSALSSWKWPAVSGEVTAVDVERFAHSREPDTFRLSVTFKFSVGDDGPYTGESFWAPVFFQNKRVPAAKDKIRVGQTVLVRYRPDDPSVNKLDHSVWRGL